MSWLGLIFFFFSRQTKSESSSTIPSPPTSGRYCISSESCSKEKKKKKKQKQKKKAKQKLQKYHRWILVEGTEFQKRVDDAVFWSAAAVFVCVCVCVLVEGFPVVGSTLLMVGGQGVNSLVSVLLDLSRWSLRCPLFLGYHSLSYFHVMSFFFFLNSKCSLVYLISITRLFVQHVKIFSLGPLRANQLSLRKRKELTSLTEPEWREQVSASQKIVIFSPKL